MQAANVFAQLAAVSQTKSFRVVRSILSVLLYILIFFIWSYAAAQVMDSETETSLARPANCLPGYRAAMPCLPDSVVIEQINLEPDSSEEKI